MPRTPTMEHTLRIANKDIEALTSCKDRTFPKYATQIMNLANANAQGTRPKVVGQMSDLVQECPGRTVAEWETWYNQKYPTAIDEATDKVYAMIEELRRVIVQIDRNMVRAWVEDLVITKTFVGLRFQEAILRRVAEHLGRPYHLSTPNDEAKGIDGYINDVPVSIKPATYKSKRQTLSEQIGAAIIFYEKKKTGLTVEFDL